jgi:hypothetical protein
VNETFSRSLFSGIPLEYVIPKSAKVVFVNDFFVKDIQGGAELTSEAIIKKSPVRVFKLHSGSVTKNLLEANKDKYWVFGNFTTLPDGMIYHIPESGIRYSIIEYDFKFCAYRSTNRHQQATGQPCNCPKDPHGLDVGRMFRKADKIFWMSQGQKEAWLKMVPGLSDHPGHLILSSVFEDSDLDKFKSLREQTTSRSPKWAVLGSGSWIKGVEETQNWCKLNRKQFEALPKLPYDRFLEAMNNYQGFVFMPLDKDTCPRVTIEAKLMGLNLHLNGNVLSRDDSWFKGTPEECEAYLRSRASWFWEQLPLVDQPRSA